MLIDWEKTVRHYKRYNRFYFRQKFYDMTLRKDREAARDERALCRYAPDWRALVDRYAARDAQRITPAYQAYTREVSDAVYAISSELAVTLLLLCRWVKPRRILDLGSGFSTFLFHHYRTAIAPEAEKPFVASVDDSAEWLEKTSRYLQEQSLAAEELWLWEDFSRRAHEPFDLIFYDIGGFDFRQTILNQIMDLLEPTGVAVFDDIHRADYGLFLRDRFGPSLFSLRGLTKDRFGRYACLYLGPSR
jgi:predicted O-methyltransferase YrrM